VTRYLSRKLVPTMMGFDPLLQFIHEVDAIAAFKLAVIIQQIYIRYVRGQTQDRRFATYAKRVLGLAAKARTLIG